VEYFDSEVTAFSKAVTPPAVVEVYGLLKKKPVKIYRFLF